MSDQDSTEVPALPNPAARVVRTLLHIGIAVAVIFLGQAVAKKFMAEDEEGGGWPGRGGGDRNAALVEVVDVEVSTSRTQVAASGLLTPSLEIDLHPRVQRVVLSVHDAFQPGGYVAAGDELVRIDDTDYELAERQASANRSSARAQRRIEEGNQQVARHEFDLYGNQELDEDALELVLREPQIEAANASYRAADAQLDQARLNVRRTRVEAPFDAVITQRDVNVGSRVTQATKLATLVGTDTFWVDAAVPVDELSWIIADETNGSLVTILQPTVWGDGVSRQGRVIRRLPTLEEGGRYASTPTAPELPSCSSGPGCSSRSKVASSSRSSPSTATICAMARTSGCSTTSSASTFGDSRSRFEGATSCSSRPASRPAPRSSARRSPRLFRECSCAPRRRPRLARRLARRRHPPRGSRESRARSRDSGAGTGLEGGAAIDS